MALKNEQSALYELKIILLNVEPTVWRRVSVPRDITLADLHAVIQVAMGWDDGHLHEFVIGRKRYGQIMPDRFGFDDPPVNETIVRLNGVAKPRAKFEYQYDFGDDWLHEIRIEREIVSESSGRKVICNAGENACPPEDCGGPYGYANMLDILVDPQHEEYGNMKEWLGDDFNPEHFDLPNVNSRLATLRV